MPSSPSGSPDDSYFNDLSQQPPDGSTKSHNGSKNGNANGDGAPDNDAQARPKRIACVLCRKRKLRCDGARPACGTCKRLSHDCAYDEVRKKSGPKRGYVKLLEARLQQVETLLKHQDPMGDGQRKGSGDDLPQAFSIPSRPNATTAPSSDTINVNLSNIDPQLLPPGTGPGNEAFLGLNMTGNLESTGGEDQFSWEMIGLGLEEPLPLQETINDLHRIYFEKVHPSLPIIHRPRYLAAMNLAPQMRPPVGLRYMMWCMAASVTDKYDAMQEHFYHRARKYLQMDEMRGHGEATITIGTCQAWLLVSMYEFKLMYFPRAWMSVGRASRLALMMGLHRLDGAGLDVKQCIPPPRDWTEREERRRTFWMAFCEDRYASIGTGWPMVVDERDIMTNLPASEDSFDKSKPQSTTSLAEVMRPGGAAQLSQLGGVVLMACLFGRNLTHLHRPTPEDQDDNLEGAFWQRHREMEGILANTGLSLPDHLRLPAGLPDPNVIFLNMNIHTSAICLHQAAIFKADRYKLPANVGSESRVRCMTAAAEIARIMRMLVHLDLSSMNPFISFCLYVAARVFVQYLKFRPKDQQMISSLQFLLTAMQALKRKNPLTESFIVQLDLDLAGAGIDVGQQKPDYYNNAIIGDLDGNVKCSPLFEVRDTQSKAPLQGANGARVPTFGNTGLGSHTNPNYVDNNPGPPFHHNRTNISMVDPSNATSFNYLNSQQASMDLPNRQRTGLTPNAAGTVTSLSPSSNEMDTSPDANGSNDQATPSTIASRHGSSSHTSFTPPGQQDDINKTSSYAAAYGSVSATGSTAGSTPSMSTTALPLGATTVATTTDQAFFPVSTEDMDFANINTNFFHDPVVSMGSGTGTTPAALGADEFQFPHGWDINMSGTGVTGGTGLTPIAEPNWNSMMEGWEGMGPPHSTDPFGRRV